MSNLFKPCRFLCQRVRAEERAIMDTNGPILWRIVCRGCGWSFLNFKLCLYTTSARIQNQENVELRIFNAPFLRGAKYHCQIECASEKYMNAHKNQEKDHPQTLQTSK